MSRIAAAILAAGTSSRLGTPKQLLELGGRPVLAHTLEAVQQTSLDPVLVVLGHEQGLIQQRVDLSQTTVVENPEYASGQSSSVRAVLRSLPDNVDAVVFVLGDQPLVDPRVIGELAEARETDRALIAQPRYAEGRGNPVLIGRELFDELSQITGDTGARPLLEHHRDQITLIDVSDKNRPGDIDTLADFEAIKQQFDELQKREK